jgi:rhamnosyltransferase subunit B
MKFLLIPMGSAGDVHPFIWLAKLLQQRGHDVVMIAQAIISDMPERAGIPTRIVGDKDAQQRVLADERLWHPRQAIHLLLENIPTWARETMAAIEQERIPHESVMIAGALALGARILAERFAIPLITVHLQPSVFMSVDESPVLMAGGEWLPHAPRWLRRAFMNLAHFQVDRSMKSPINTLRRESGIPGKNVSGILKHYWHSPDGVLCLFPDWYARKAPDWPAQAVTTRFPLYDETGDRPLEPALETFLAAGDPPIIITAGSANTQAARFFQQATEALKLLNRRGILLTRFPEQLPPNLPSIIKHFDYLPFSQVFPRAAAVIHHGGIGTTAQCFAAAVPQLLMPMAHDQPDNATRIKRLAVGDYLYPKSFTPPRIANKLRHLLDSPEVSNACKNVQNLMRVQMPAESVAAIVEQMISRSFKQTISH